VALLMAIVATICAVMVAWVFVLAWRDGDVRLTVLLGVVLFSLLVLAMLAVRVSLRSASANPPAVEEASCLQLCRIQEYRWDNEGPLENERERPHSSSSAAWTLQR
jgi:hypothetical protein